jgi:hypothetical protein
MSTEKDEVIEMTISEGSDGSAVVDLPDDIESPDEQEQSAPQQASDAAEQGDDNDSDDDADDPNDEEAVRAQKRARRKARKEYHKQTQQAEKAELAYLKRQNAELVERMVTLERKSHGTDLARLNKAIEDQQMRINFAKQKIAEATENQNGELLASAQEMWFESRRNLEMLENVRKKASQIQQAPVQQAIDPRLQRNASNWMSNNPWYDPNGGNPDSRVALTIDQALAEEGWDPKSPDYWDELDNRLQRYLPHRYTDTAGEKPAQRRPRNVVTGSGRESATSSGSGGRNQFTLSPEQVRAMKDAGMWDDPEKRAKMIRRYAQEARQNNGYRS